MVRVAMCGHPKNLLFYSTLCSNSLEFQVAKCYGGSLLWYLNPLPDVIFKNLAFFSSCECLLSKDTGNSDSQNDIY